MRKKTAYSSIQDAFQAVFNELVYLPATLKIVRQAAPRWTFIWAVMLVIQGLVPVGIVYLTREVVNSIADALTTGVSTQALLMVGGLGLLMLIQASLSGLNKWIQTAQAELVTDHVKEMIQRKTLALDVSFYESAESQDMLHRASVDANNQPLSLVTNLGLLIQSGITLVSMVFVLLPYGWWIPLVLVGGTLPMFIVILRIRLKQYNWQHRRARLSRQVNYYDWLLTYRQYAAETRLFSLGLLYIERFKEKRSKLREEQIAFAREESGIELAAAALGLMTLAGALAWLTWDTIETGGELGDLALFYAAFSQGQTLTRAVMRSLEQIYRNLLFLKNLFAFLELEPRLPETGLLGELSITLQDAIELHAIDFSYPGTERTALSNFSLRIPAGQNVAIVGENGAGKSTLIKLITRLYDPTVGRITLDGKDIREFPLADWRRLFTVLFQEPVQYHMTANENVALGDWWSRPSPADLEAAAINAGADSVIRKLPKAYESQLGTLFNGHQLSVGEWQRVSLARAYVRNAQFIILDEPTSAMDSWAEAEWLDRFERLAEDKTSLIITHRLTTAMRADLIYVMVDGNLVESGTHDELIAAGGMYAESWYRAVDKQTRAM